MREVIKKNEMFKTSQMMILTAYTIFSVILIGESLLMQWEKWAIIPIIAGVGTSWFLHIQRHLTADSRLWIYSILMMATFFFYGIHDTSTFDLAIVMSAVMILYTMTGIKKLITLCQMTYYLTMVYELFNLKSKGETFDSLVISRTFLHMAVILMIGWFCKTIIEKWRSVLDKTYEEIDFLSESTNRLDDFLANVSHEIRTPVNAVVGLSAVCIEKETSRDKLKDLTSIQEAGKRVAEQISDILDYSEIDRKMLVRNDEDYMLDSVLHDLVVQLRPYKKQDIELVIDVSPAIPTVMNTDVSKLKRILWHLIMNGLKYTNEGGVYVRITSVEEEYGINLNIEVTDTGIGMGESELERINERFYQADSGRARMGGGLGLGIPIVSGFVSALSGFMTVESKPGEGTTVRVSLPQKVINPVSCMSLEKRDQLSLGAYLHFDKYKNPNVREYYNMMVGNIVRGLGVHMHRVDNAESLKKLVSSVRLTHLFIAQEEYESAPEYIEQLSGEMVVVIVADRDFELPPGSRIRIMEKPFYCFPVAVVLNKEIGEADSNERMLCPGVEALVVDDEPMNLIVAKGIFNRYEMKVTTAASGQEAIDLCREKKFDIIFMDHMMPVMDGIETAKKLMTDRTHMSIDAPIVALTANAVSTAKEMFMSEGFDGFVSKPVEIAELERVLKKVLPKNAVIFEEIGEDDNIEADGLHKLRATGVDTDMGLQYSQRDEELYRTLLKQYVTEAEGKQEGMDRYFKEGDFKNYEILVHALKSTSKMIGAATLSDKARTLENLAKAGGDGITQRMHDSVMSMYKEVAESISETLDIDVQDVQTVEEANDGILEFTPSGDKDEPVVLEFTPE